MTDDLAAMNNPAEVEHMFRPDEAPLHLYAGISNLDALPLLILIFATGVAFSSSLRLRLFFLPATLLESALRAVGIRPPPSFTLRAI